MLLLLMMLLLQVIVEVVAVCSDRTDKQSKRQPVM